MSEPNRPPRPFLVVSACMAALGVVAILVTLRLQPSSFDVRFFLLLGAVVIASSFQVRLGMYTVSLTFPMVLASLPLGGPTWGVLVAAASSIGVGEIRDRTPAAVIVFNFGQGAVYGSAAGWVYVAVGGPVAAAGTPLNSEAMFSAVIALLLAGSVLNVLNMAMTAMGMWLLRGYSFAKVFGELTRYLPTQLALALVGLLMAQVLSISVLAFPLFLFPLFLARQTFERYAQMRDAYLDTIRALVGALEAKDPYTKGHSERVANYAVRIASRYGLDERARSKIEAAALLHDIGKLQLERRVLSKPEALSEHETASVRRHPEAGETMIAHIPALSSLAATVGAHHERMDGSGYPHGISDEAISIEARILAVADAFDAMTSDRPYRRALSVSQALRELRLCAGTQFDASVVGCLVSSIEGESDFHNRRHLETGEHGLEVESA